MISRLGRIEDKLNDIIRFLVQIPELMLKIADYGAIKTRQMSLRGQAARVKTELPKFLARRNTRSADALQSRADDALQTPYEMLTEGKEWYVAGIHAMGTALPIYARLIRFHRDFAESLGVWGRLYSEVITPWIDPKIPDSYVAVRALYETQKAEADAAEAYPPNRHFLISIFGPITGIRPRPEARWVGNSALLRQRDQQGMWGDGGADERGRTVISTSETPPPTDHPAFGGLAVLPWWPVEVGFENKDHVFHRAHARVNELSKRHFQWGAKIDEMNITITAIRNLLLCCKKLEQLEGGKVPGQKFK